MKALHSPRLAASKAHRRFVAGMKIAARKTGRQIPDPSGLSPTIVGGQRLGFPVPPRLEEALGYRGTLRFVGFGFSPRTRSFGFCDGGDDIPSDQDLWLQFLRHPIIAPHLPEGRYPTLYGVFSAGGRSAPQKRLGGSTARQGERLEPAHCLLLDRQERQPYVCRKDEAILFFALIEPEDADPHSVFVDGLLMSPGNEDYKVPAPIDLAKQIRVFLDDQLEITRGPATRRTEEPRTPSGEPKKT